MADTPRKKSRAAEPLNLENLMGNKPPQALDMEEAVLGAMLVEPATIDESMEACSFTSSDMASKIIRCCGS